jgi:uncharacterized protein YbjT (DUF2867 family)
MKVLLTGVTGYIAKRLLPALIAGGHEVYCCVRDRNRFDVSKYSTGKIKVIEVDFLKKKTLKAIPDTIDAAYYLIHSMSVSINHFNELELESARNFRERIEQTSVEQVIYLSGIVNNKELSKHLLSRKAVEEELKLGSYHLTTLRAGIIVGSGSASFEIMRDLVEKLPVMVAPQWLSTQSQPIAISNVIEFLQGCLLNPSTFGQNFDIGGPEILTYKQMLLQFSEVRGLKRRIFVVPVMTPKLSSYWLYFITSTSFNLAANLVDSMKVDVVCRPNDLHKILGISLIEYRQAVKMAFDKIEQKEVVSSWTDAFSGNALDKGVSTLVNVPEHGTLHDTRSLKLKDERLALKRIWAIGGKTGWYYADWLWELRGFMDKLAGGVGLRRGRRSPIEIVAGDSLDFWRVLIADQENKRLLLYAEMKLPGEAWLEFKIKDNILYQVATFRPLGLWGRAYWYSVLPLHFFVFRGMIRNIAKPQKQ